MKPVRCSRSFSLLALVVCGACQAPADASVLLDLDAFSQNGLPGLRAPHATLDVVDDDGEHVAVEVATDDEDSTYVKSPLPVPCDGDGQCRVKVRLRPARVTFTLHVTAADRCGARAELVSLRSQPVELSPYEAVAVELSGPRYDFDDDEDGVLNVLEHATCGRTDFKDGAAPPQACADATDVCCAGASPLEGHLTAFEGGAHTNAAGNAIDVAAFALDATEVTWRQLARCVAAGACLANRPEHPARAQLLVANPSEPVVGLVPADAQALCAYYGKRLPRDDEWDYAAAHRDGTDERARYPWDDDGDAVGCTPDFPGISANLSTPGQACPGAPVAVGSYPTSYAARGAGPALADLGGNVAEWTLVEGGGAPDVVEVPPGHDAVVLRGGGARSPLPLLENDLPVIARFPRSGDADAWRADIVRLSATAGVRCAIDVVDASVEPPFIAEPSCGDGE